VTSPSSTQDVSRSGRTFARRPRRKRREATARTALAALPAQAPVAVYVELIRNIPLRKLNDPEPWLERMEAGLSLLGEKRGVTLYQLPPHFPRDLDRLDRFLGVVPAGHRVAVEFRHPTWDVEDTFAVLERHGLRPGQRSHNIRLGDPVEVNRALAGMQLHNIC
jgi:uncharacterized protein YecE (DUF72 family)